MKVATIVPTPHLDLVQTDDYHLCVVPELRKEGEYLEFYKQQAQQGKFVIVDNGAADGGTASIQEVYEYAVEIGASELQLPDVFFDKHNTLCKMYESLNYLAGRDIKCGIQVVPQGKSFEEWIDCAQEMLRHPGITCIGVPKNLIKIAGALGRLRAIRWLVEHTNIDGVNLHLLGCWDDPREIGVIYRMAKGRIPLRGVDSGIAAIYAQAQRPLDPTRYLKPNQPVDFEREVCEELLQYNIKQWKEACRHEYL